MKIILKALVSGLSRRAGSDVKDITAVQGETRITRSRVIVKSDGKYHIFNKDSAQILDES